MIKTIKNKERLVRLGLGVISLYGVASMQLHVREIDHNDNFMLGKYDVSVSMSEASATCGSSYSCSGGGGQCGSSYSCTGQ